MTRDEYIGLLKSIVLKAGKKAVIEYVVSRFAFFSLPIINPLLGLVVGKILEILIDKTEVAAFFLYIDFRTSLQGREFEKAALAYFEFKGDDKHKKVLEDQFIASFKLLAKFNS